jgi:hypothetical protein
MTFNSFQFDNIMISKTHIDNLSAKWDELKQVVNKMQMNDRDLYRINEELTTNIKQYLNNAKAGIELADTYRSEWVEFERKENEYRNAANGYVNRRYWNTWVWRSKVERVWRRPWWRGRGRYVNEVKWYRTRVQKSNQYNIDKYNENINAESAEKKKKEAKQEEERAKRNEIMTAYANAQKIYVEIYNKIYPLLQQTSNAGVTSAGTAGQIANSTITLDNKSLPQATSLDTQTSITNNIGNSNAVLDNQNLVNDYNQHVSNRRIPISDIYSHATNAKNIGETANAKSIALKQQANELSITAGQEKKNSR